MPCYGPITAYRPQPGSGDGRLVFNKKKSHSGIAVSLPCGRCIGCRLEKSRQWAVRCMHEARMWKDNAFVTLTYDQDNLPQDWGLDKEHMQLFMKRLRFRKFSSKANPVRFYGCGEYGGVSRRPHYHVLLFNCSFGDKLFYTENSRGEKLYTSQELRDVWPFGHNVIGDVSFDSARYVAGYVLKKVTGDKAEAAYMRYNSEGRVFQVQPEFGLMSRRPGLGAGYYAKFGKEVAAHDSIIVNGKEAPSTRFYDERVKLLPSPTPGLHDTSAYAINKRARKRKAVAAKSDNTSRRRVVKEAIVMARLKQKESKL